MQKVYDFLKKTQTYYLATVEGDQPRVRPFGTVNIFDGKLYIQTGKSKDVWKQIAANPKVEICALDPAGGAWLRIQATAVEDPRREAKKSMLDAYPSLRDRYSEDDSNTQVLYLKDAVATFAEFGKKPKTVKF
ncbi:MAG: pyridoxamine 5'-phosphate oxidase family protein [Treponema sp.]|nr:pyridoxamine 5'-phosphate oxidase family protein [Treponema sp.]